MSDSYKGSIICLGGSVESLPIVQKVLSMDYRAIVLDGNENCVVVQWANSIPRTFRLSFEYGLRDKIVFLKANCYNSDSCLKALLWANTKEFWKYDNETFKLDDLRGVLCCAVDSPLACAQIAEKYHLPTIGVEAAKLGVNKFYQWQRLEEHGFVVPRTKVVNPEMSWDEVKDYQIVKPVDSRGARGVRFYTATDYREAFTEALGYSPTKMIIAQEYRPGTQLSTESVVYNNEVQMTSVAERNYDRLSQFRPYIVEDGCNSIPPSRLNRRINDLIERACLALGWNNCTVKGDLILDGNLLYILELAPRLSGGFLSSHITPLSMGWDILGDAIRLVVGEKPILEFGGMEQFVSQRYIFPRRGDVGKRISKLPQFPPAVNFGTWNVKVGDTIQRVQHHPSRLGQIIVARNSGVEAVAEANEIVAELAIEIGVE